MARGVGGHSPANVQKYLSGVHYPAGKDQLIDAARHNKAPDEVLDTIRNLPYDEFNGPQEVMKAYGEED